MTLGTALAALALAAPAGAQGAQGALVGGGNADWGVKQSFRNYVTGTFAQGSYEASQGASKNADGTIDFTPASGAVGPGAVADVAFGGMVHFTGHAGQLDLKLSDLRAEMKGETGTLFLDAESKSLESGATESYDDVDFATLSAAGAPPAEAGATTTWGPIAATLTENGARAFAGFYDPGTALDPITFTVERADSPGAIEAVKGKQEVGPGGGRVDVAEVRCEVAECELETPKKLKGDGISAKLVAPGTVAGGEAAKVKAKVGRAAARELGDGTARLRGELVVSSAGVESAAKVAIKVVGR